MEDDALDEAEVFITSQTKKFILAKVNKEGDALLRDYLLKHNKGWEILLVFECVTTNLDLE